MRHLPGQAPSQLSVIPISSKVARGIQSASLLSSSSGHTLGKLPKLSLSSQSRKVENMRQMHSLDESHLESGLLRKDAGTSVIGTQLAVTDDGSSKKNTEIIALVNFIFYFWFLKLLI
mmetsp:Transcript_8344/g.12851  ORF Transcript_8344/g.12851 Transcript_8344/m.12851 type:complete len:118 (-) Transcript_8344:35-388(-)